MIVDTIGLIPIRGKCGHVWYARGLDCYQPDAIRHIQDAYGNRKCPDCLGRFVNRLMESPIVYIAEKIDGNLT